MVASAFAFSPDLWEIPGIVSLPLCWLGVPHVEIQDYRLVLIRTCPPVPTTRYLGAGGARLEMGIFRSC